MRGGWRRWHSAEQTTRAHTSNYQIVYDEQIRHADRRQKKVLLGTSRSSALSAVAFLHSSVLHVFCKCAEVLHKSSCTPLLCYRLGADAGPVDGANCEENFTAIQSHTLIRLCLCTVCVCTAYEASMCAPARNAILRSFRFVFGTKWLPLVFDVVLALLGFFSGKTDRERGGVDGRTGVFHQINTFA